jgi:hypothetical protein
MFQTDSAVYPLPPAFERGWTERSTHQGDDLLFAQSELKSNGFKWRSVFPGHFYDPIPVFGCHVFLFEKKTIIIRKCLTGMEEEKEHLFMRFFDVR